jgi:hypothetical protein
MIKQIENDNLVLLTDITTPVAGSGMLVVDFLT